MANHRKKQVGKRKSKGWRKRSPKCTLCTYFRWLGNAKGRKRHSYYRQQNADSSEDQTLTISLGARSVVPATRPQSQINKKKEQQQMATRKTGGLDPQIVREIEKQTQKQQEIDNKRTKQRLIFWSLIIFGTAMAVGVGIVLSDLAEWQKIENSHTIPRKRWLRLNIDYHFIETCAPYKIWGDDRKRYTVYTMKYVLGPKPEVPKSRSRFK